MSDGLRAAYWTAVQQPPAAGWDRALFNTHNIRNVLDVGANVGGFVTAWLGCGATKVHAIEPVPECYDKLAAMFATDPRVECHRIGASDAPGFITGANVFHCWTLLPDGTRTVDRGLAIDPAVDFKGKQPFDVELFTVDDLVQRWSFEPDFIKIDVDGYDARVLRGASNYLARRHPVIMLELSYYPEFLGDCCECMVRSIYDLGYTMRCLNGINDGRKLDTLKDAMRIYPWDTSFDVICEPRGIS